MKSILIALIGIFIFVNAYAQNIPAPVKDSLSKKFPGATNVKWVKQSKNKYEAYFKMNNEKQSADFSDKGDWLESETVVAFNTLPTKVQDAFNKNQKGHKANRSVMIETSNGSKKYKVDYKKGKKSLGVFYDDQGNKVK